ncbi:hypothetical protein L6R49_24785 [Myxococcota bacterium]|nr:hypothetical protein [Myxococcota bacterium]
MNGGVKHQGGDGSLLSGGVKPQGGDGSPLNTSADPQGGDGPGLAVVVRARENLRAALAIMPPFTVS